MQALLGSSRWSLSTCTPDADLQSPQIETYGGTHAGRGLEHPSCGACWSIFWHRRRIFFGRYNVQFNLWPAAEGRTAPGADSTLPGRSRTSSKTKGATSGRGDPGRSCILRGSRYRSREKSCLFCRLADVEIPKHEKKWKVCLTRVWVQWSCILEKCLHHSSAVVSGLKGRPEYFNNLGNPFWGRKGHPGIWGTVRPSRTEATQRLWHDSS